MSQCSAAYSGFNNECAKFKSAVPTPPVAGEMTFMYRQFNFSQSFSHGFLYQLQQSAVFALSHGSMSASTAISSSIVKRS